MSRARFEQIAWAEYLSEDAPEFSGTSLFQSAPWIEFLSDVQHAEPVTAVLADGSDVLGRFTGLVVAKLGLTFLGSPLPGWTTPYMGFNLAPGVPRAVAARALADFAFKDLGAVHLELRDRWLTDADVAGLGFSQRADIGYDDRTFEIDLRKTEDELFDAMTSACRRCVRQAEKRGVTIEEAHGEAFADEFFPQIRDIFLRQGLIPTYGIDRVRALIRHLEPSGQLLLLRARDADGLSIATGIFPACGDLALFWGGASVKEHQHNRPNEALHWHAMRHWKARGITRYDLGGFAEYKRKYGGEEISIPGFKRSRLPVIAVARNVAPAAMRAKQIIHGRLGQRKIAAEPGLPLAASAE